MSDDAFEQLERTAQKIMALIDHLQAENKKLRADNERLLIDGIHTCHDQCQRVACVVRRERDAALADVERLREHIAELEAELEEPVTEQWLARLHEKKERDPDEWREWEQERERVRKEFGE